MKFFFPFRILGHGPVLQGQRVMLRAPIMEDFSQWVSLRQESQDFLKPWEPEWSTNEFSRSSFGHRIKAYRAWADAEQALTFFLFDNSTTELLGGVTLGNIRRGVQQSGTLGYWIGERFARKGYMAEAVRLVVEHALGTMNLHRVEAACLPRNTASRALIKSCGFVEEGLAKSYIKIAGQWEDHILHAIVSNGN